VVRYDQPNHGLSGARIVQISLGQKTQAILGGINSRDLRAICLNFELPRSGILMGWEWIHFINYHTQRHLYQLDKIRTKLA